MFSMPRSATQALALLLVSRPFLAEGAEWPITYASKAVHTHDSYMPELVDRLKSHYYLSSTVNEPLFFLMAFSLSTNEVL